MQNALRQNGAKDTAMTHPPADPIDTPHQRLRFARAQAGYASASDAARAMGIGEPTYLGHENGNRGLSRAARRYALFFHVSLDWLLGGRGEFEIAGGEARLATTLRTAVGLAEPSLPAPPRNAEVGGPARFGATIPAYGQAVGGKDGEFILNGNRIVDILAPPSLQGVQDAYAVYVVGDSMEPRYFAGETVFVNPRLPVRRRDFVVAQIAAEEGEPPHAYIKRFVAREARLLRLEQFNPKKTLEFPVGRVISVHRIIMGGDG
jgi:phage repressor protein C with HTH and peptisase S24 domain